MRPNPFEAPDKADQKRQAQAQEAAKAHLEEAVKKAKDCLATPQFQEFRKAYIRARQEILDEIEAYVNPDPVKYAFVVSSLLAEARTLKKMLGNIELTAGQLDKKEG